jgi:hypothetical protein
MLSSILVLCLTPYVDEIIGDNQSGFRRNRSTTGYIVCVRRMSQVNVTLYVVTKYQAMKTYHVFN